MLNLYVPGTDPVLKQSTETRPKAVSAWLDRLPFSIPAEAAQQLVMALYALNRLPLDAAERTALLTLYRPVVARAVASLEAMLAESGVPPSPQMRQTGALLRELHIEHSFGYKQVLLSLINRRFGRPNPKHLAEASTRLLAVLRDIQAACYLTYTPLPAGLWQELHQVYQFALSTGLADDAGEDAPPASRAYCQALLTALADPPHMNPAQLALTQIYLSKFASLAVLAPLTVNPPKPGFLITVKADRPPGQLSANPEEGDLWLCTEALCRHLHETGQRLRAGDTPRQAGLPHGMESEPSKALLKRLLKLWGNSAQRVFKRHARPGETMQLVAGLGAIHRLLDPAPPATADDTEMDNHLRIRCVETSPAAPLATPAPPQITQWSIINDSAAGQALLGTPDPSMNLKVGDPLALRGDESMGWSLGVIRWVRMRDARQVELGIERLSPQIQAVWVQPLRNRRNSSPEPALFIPGLAALKQPDRLLLPRHLYRIGMDADVWHASRQYTVSFGVSHENTVGFDLIDFTTFTDDQHD